MELWLLARMMLLLLKQLLRFFTYNFSEFIWMREYFTVYSLYIKLQAIHLFVVIALTLSNSRHWHTMNNKNAYSFTQNANALTHWAISLFFFASYSFFKIRNAIPMDWKLYFLHILVCDFLIVDVHKYKFKNEEKKQKKENEKRR